MSSLHGGSLKLTLSVPLRLYISEERSLYGKLCIVYSFTMQFKRNSLMNTTWKRLPEIISASKKSNLKLKRSFFKKLTICLFSIFFIEIKIESRLFYIDIIDYHRILLGYFKECYELKQQILYFMNFISYSEGCLIEFAIYF